MTSDLKIYYLKDVLNIVNAAAMEIMMQPQKAFVGDQATKVESLAQMNDRVAQYNDGVRSLAVYIANKLRKEAEQDDT